MSAKNNNSYFFQCHSHWLGIGFVPQRGKIPITVGDNPRQNKPGTPAALKGLYKGDGYIRLCPIRGYDAECRIFRARIRECIENQALSNKAIDFRNSIMN